MFSKGEFSELSNKFNWVEIGKIEKKIFIFVSENMKFLSFFYLEKIYFFF